MKKSINFIICLHNHQPVGNFENVLEDNYRQAYEPFLKLVRQYPQIKLSLHYTGALLEWIEHTHPKFLTDLKSLVASGQAELLGGGFYEPILTLLPEADKRGQIDLFSDYLVQHFGQRPTGLWLSDRVWEPALARDINEAGLRYTVLDDFHFHGVGLPEKHLRGYYITEDSGRTLNIFAASEPLRYAIPFKSPEAVLGILHEAATESGDKIMVYADDGEKFGAWPGTYRHCYDERWLERFFQALQANQDWIKVITFNEALQKFPPVGKVYLPAGSYREMTEWSLPAETALGYHDLLARLKQCGLYEAAFSFIKGGFWRNFRIKYPEIDLMAARMWEVSREVNALDKSSVAYQSARPELYRAQCNCPYWHGVFGGFYLPHLRQAVYRHLIRAENTAQPATNNGQLQESDFDCDGHSEIKLSNQNLACYFKPAQGGALYEFDIKAREFNPLATVTRRQESYHYQIIKSLSLISQPTGHHAKHLINLIREKGLENLLYYDNYQRRSLLDHFFAGGTRLGEVAKSHYTEEGDFLNGPYSFNLTDGKNPALNLKREGYLRRDNKTYPVRMEKTIKFLSQPKVGLEIHYRLTNIGTESLETIFGVEFNLAMVAGETPERFYYDGGNQNLGKLISSGESHKQALFGIKSLDQKIDIAFHSTNPAELWYFPVQTISQSEEGFDLLYQNSVLIPHWWMVLAPGQTWENRLVKEVKLL